MILDCHVHIAACTAGHGVMSPRLLNSLAFQFLRWKFALAGTDASTEKALCQLLLDTLDRTPELDAAVVLAFDAVYDRHGRLDQTRTHLYVSNDYVMELARRHRKVLFGASVHPCRKDAIAELERCVAGGAVLLKWLPIVQDFDPSDPICIPFYEALAHHRLPLLCHTGSEQALPNLNPHVADPILLKPALDRGVRVIMAHCGSRGLPWHTDYTPTFIRMAREYEHCYGDTSALNLPTRWYALQAVVRDKVAREKLIHGSDWPILPLPCPAMLGWDQAFELLIREPNWLRRDVLIKRGLGLDDAYWHRAAKVLRLAGVAGVQQAVAAGR